MIKFLKTAGLASFALWNGFCPQASAQSDDHAAHYFVERARGDEAAAISRAAFELEVCKASVQAFCPQAATSNFQNAASCLAHARKCGAIETSVVHRFISKYGGGEKSARLEVMPALQKFFSSLAEAKESLLKNQTPLTARLNSRIAYISRITHLKPEVVQTRVSLFLKNLLQSTLPALTVDYWGYFQQQEPLRHQVTLTNDSISSLMLSFRWCGEPHRFADESSFILGDFLAIAISSDVDALRLRSAGTYTEACKQLEDWY